jgi:formiminotetrahydrofolate cyclodeaminase
VHDQTTPIQQFLDAAAARQPTPGGGSVAALAGALAASMGEMVLNYSVGKKGLESHTEQLKTALAEFHRAREMMVELMLEDQSAYEALTAAKKMPPDSPQRAAAVASAVLICARVPQTMAATAVAILELADTLVDVVNPHLLSDLAVCAELAMATTRSALYNVWVNLRDIGDQRDRRRFEEDGEKLRVHAVNAIRRLMPRIWAKV